MDFVIIKYVKPQRTQRLSVDSWNIGGLEY